MRTTVPCRVCGTPLRHSVVDLGPQPLAGSFLTAAELDRPEPSYPLHAWVCGSCWLMQLDEVVPPQKIFSEYFYFSSYSDTWLDHARRYAEAMIERLGLGRQSLVVEIASNDGYLLRNFVWRGIPVLGIEPAANVAAAAVEAGVHTEVAFFGAETAERLANRGASADLLIANNVLAHVPELNDFLAGLARLLDPGGTLTAEFHHVLALLQKREFDTIYHEHYSYLSLTSIEEALGKHGLVLTDVEELPTHGGSLRIFARREGDRGATVRDLLDRERAEGLTDVATYGRLGADADLVRRELRTFLEQARAQGRQVAGYGAPGKGNTLLNFCGVSTDLIAYTVDRSPHKQGCFLPGSHLPIHRPERLLETRPDYVLILPWNLKEEIVQQMSAVREWGGRFVVPIPKLEVV